MIEIARMAAWTLWATMIIAILWLNGIYLIPTLFRVLTKVLGVITNIFLPDRR